MGLGGRDEWGGEYEGVGDGLWLGWGEGGRV